MHRSPQLGPAQEQEAQQQPTTANPSDAPARRPIAALARRQKWQGLFHPGGASRSNAACPMLDKADAQPQAPRLASASHRDRCPTRRSPATSCRRCPPWQKERPPSQHHPRQPLAKVRMPAHQLAPQLAKPLTDGRRAGARRPLLCCTPPRERAVVAAGQAHRSPVFGPVFVGEVAAHGHTHQPSATSAAMMTHTAARHRRSHGVIMGA